MEETTKKDRQKFRFTCLDPDTDKYRRIFAKDAADADSKMTFGASLIIKGTAESIGARRVKLEPEENRGLEIDQVKGLLRRGTKYSIIVASSPEVMIAKAEYFGESLTAEEYLVFTRNCTMFLVAKDCLYVYRTERKDVR